MSTILLAAAFVFGVLGSALVLSALGALRRRRGQWTAISGLGGLLCLTLAALAATLSVSVRGYRALIREEVAATVRMHPAGPRRFRASISYPDGREEVFDLSGDAIYVDAHILKWRPWANALGLHTSYELDRVAGRYDRLEDERGAPRTVFSLARPKPIDLFAMIRRFPRLSAAVDAEYGSATFVGVGGPATYEILVSTSGLLARPIEGARPARLQ